ncbi:MAG: hypothetical protein OXG15_00140, partial [Gammaproteobacteria bacterium]|nr:hypothetical protein [Gammaproteobacteria bacterium]
LAVYRPLAAPADRISPKAPNLVSGTSSPTTDRRLAVKATASCLAGSPEAARPAGSQTRPPPAAP